MECRYVPVAWRWRDPNDKSKKTHKKAWLYGTKKPKYPVDGLEALYSQSVVELLYDKIDKLQGSEAKTELRTLPDVTALKQDATVKQYQMIGSILSSTTREIQSPLDANGKISKDEARTFIAQWCDFASATPKQRLAVACICEKLGIAVPASYDQRFIRALFATQTEVDLQNYAGFRGNLYHDLQEAAFRGEEYPITA